MESARESQIDCGTFMDWSFGAQLKRARVAKGFTLREYCRQNGMDSGNYSNLENNRIAPPDSRGKLLDLVRPLEISETAIEMLAIAAFNFHLGRVQRKFWSK